MSKTNKGAATARPSLPALGLAMVLLCCAARDASATIRGGLKVTLYGLHYLDFEVNPRPYLKITAKGGEGYADKTLSSEVAKTAYTTAYFEPGSATLDFGSGVWTELWIEIWNGNSRINDNPFKLPLDKQMDMLFGSPKLRMVDLSYYCS